MSDDIKIYGKLTNATTDNVLAGADQIYDSYQKKFQEDINKLIPKLEGGLIPSKYLPSYVDDVVEGRLIDTGTFEVTSGEPQQTGVIYLDTTTNISYRWSGSQYVKISSPLELGTTEDTALKGSLGISSVMSGRSALGVEIFLFKYSGSSIKCLIPSATQTMPGVMSAADKTVVDKANYVITAEPVVGNLSVDAKGNQVSIGYLQVEDGNNSVSESVNLPLATITSAGLLSKEDKNKSDLLDKDIAEVEITGFTKELSPNKVTLKLKSANQTLSLDLDRASALGAGVVSSSDIDVIDKFKNLFYYKPLVDDLEVNPTQDTVEITYQYFDPNDYSVYSDDAVIPQVTTTKAGVMSSTDKTKLDTLDWYFEE